jgi:phage baseplate assembly protein W
MANINLNNYFRKSTDKVSPVDSKIILNKGETNKEKWGDLKLDLTFNELKERALNAKENTKDLQRTVNEESVITALRNIFNTKKCSRLLNPEMEFQIGSYLFEPLSLNDAWFLGYDICMQLPMYEPRIKINNVDITANIDEAVYIIELSVGIPSVSGSDFKISSILSQDGYEIM